MRTLLTQMRVKRLIRLHAESVRRLKNLPAASRQAAVRRLLQALEDVRTAWQAESEAGVRLSGLQRHMTRGLAAAGAAIASLERPGANLVALDAEFREAVLPLLFFLRGLEDCREEALVAWLEPQPLRQSA